MIRENIQKFYDPVEMPGGWTHVLPDTLNVIDLYYNSQYLSGPYDNRGFRKFFFNINKPPCDIATKFIDLDTKDIILKSEHRGDEFKVFLFQKDLHQFMKETDFASLLNEISVDLPKYGHIVIKKGKDRWEKVSIQNLRMDPSISKLENGDFVYELHQMTRGKIEEANWNGDVARLLERDGEMFYIYECYYKKGKKWFRKIYADVFAFVDKEGNITRTTETVLNGDGIDELPAIVVDKEREVKFPYRELKWDSVPGRWFGQGFVEYLEDEQVATNEAENLERKGLMYKSLQGWYTDDEDIGGSNVLTDFENGDIIKARTITPIQKDNSDLAAFNATRARWTESAQRKTFSFPVASGQLEALPSRTPLGAINLSTGMVTSYFDFKRENYGIFLRKLVIDDIIPDFKNKKRSEHVLTFYGSERDIDKYDTFVTELMIEIAVAKKAEQTGFFPTQLSRDLAREQIKKQLRKQEGRHSKIPEALYDNAKYYVDVITTGEQIDLGRQSAIKQFALQVLGTNPAIVQNKVTRQIFFSLLEEGGMNPHEIDIRDMEQAPLQQGGSVASPGPQTPGVTSNSNAV